MRYPSVGTRGGFVDLARLRYRVAPTLRRGARDVRRALDRAATRGLGRDLARILSEHRTPRALHPRIRARWNDALAREIVRLLLHRVLEVESDTGFVSGAAAAPLIFPAGRPTTIPDTISSAALRCVFDVQLPEDERAMRLYAYNRLPAQPRWRQHLATPADVANWLGTARGPLRHTLADHWNGRLEPRPGDVWLFWTPRARARARGEPRLLHKLYVSVAPEHVPEAFAATVETLAATRPMQFKVAADAHGFLRPDKLIIYCVSRPAMQRLARELAPRLALLQPHALPFTGSLDDRGRLSWGVDLPARADLGGGREDESWRMWISRRLALALSEAQRAGLTSEGGVRFALDWLRVDGVDTESWTPNAMLLRELAPAP
jgi:hypothetical protein